MLVPSITLKEEHNDNIFLTAQNATSDFITTIVPGVRGRARTERFDGDLTVGFNYLDYLRHNLLDGLDFFGRNSLAYRVTPRLSVSAGGGYVRNSRPDQLSATGIALNAGSDRYNAQGGANLAVDELTNTSLTYGYDRQKFDNALQLPTTTHSVTLALDHDLDKVLPRTRSGVTFLYSNDDVVSSQVDNYAASLVMSYTPRELWKMSGSVGGRFTHSTFESSGHTFRTDDTGLIGSLSLGYADDRNDGTLSFTRDLATASGGSSVTERTSLNLSLGRRLTEELRGEVASSFAYNRTRQNQFSAVEINEKTLTARGSLRYTMTRYLDAEALYQYTHVDSGGEGGAAVQNLVMLRVNLSYEMGR
ncbi:hypothetical protein GPICK_07760 [Geobacter pickeringii]|uniref:TIGR03016 family PEP-CTERM system-associated outer membrane protein n=1 Tax=Geobacter pickeringii TaxID=345632 RepID=A0A0B5BDN2_9BACT|nr:hypothetical protein GPICK_07760 [Geobacter pickeringii]